MEINAPDRYSQILMEDRQTFAIWAIEFPSNHLFRSSLVGRFRLEDRIWVTQNLPILPKGMPM
jgi:hypothetical protein